MFLCLLRQLNQSITDIFICQLLFKTFFILFSPTYSVFRLLAYITPFFNQLQVLFILFSTFLTYFLITDTYIIYVTIVKHIFSL